ncbi:LamG-like jellyroll fold domain-containing protein [Cellulomonas palmilytica]|uniref:LamG-like jellyroll fold domain-containing protein n=1 Tax=Cellulomonas palmilytica TaxID=2608402 RepID=UPI001F2BB95B|nr:LamG-like jellyroll fold domain-containing protein [Cellulomonas palmilytica]
MRGWKRGRRVVGAGVAGALVAAAAYAAVDAVDEAGPDCGRVEAPDIVAALLLAQACGHDVVALDSLAPQYSLTATPRGTVREDSSVSAVRTQASGRWAAVDPAVVRDEETGSLTVASPVHPIEFAPQDGGLVSIESGSGSVTIGVPMDLGEPRASGSRVTWGVLDAVGELIDGVSVVVQVSPDASGVVPTIEVQDRAAYEELVAAVGEVRFDVVTSGALNALGDGAGGFDIVDASSGELAFAVGDALQWDSSGGEPLGDGQAPDEPVDVERPNEGDVVAPMVVDVVDDVTVAVSVDESMATDPATTWPVTFDPSVTGVTLNQWVVVRNVSSWGSVYGSNDGGSLSGNEGVGYCAVTAMGCTAVHKSRMFWQFTGLSALPYIAADDVVSAQFRVRGTHSWSCTMGSLDLYLSGGISADTTWPGPSDVLKLGSISPKHYTGCDGTQDDEWDILAAARQYAGQYSRMTLGLRAASEIASNSWWRYDMGSATVSLEYNRAPVVKTSSMRVIAGTEVLTCDGVIAINTTQPQLSIVADDNDNGDSVAVTMQVYASGSELLEWSYTSPSAAPGATFAKTVSHGVLGQGSHRWRARARDASGVVSAWSPWCTFTIDYTAPNPPTITPVPVSASDPDVEAEYKNDEVEHGGKGVRGCFILRTEASDAVRFNYRWSDVTSGYTTVAVGPDMSARICTLDGHPTTTGTNTLTVSATDRARNTTEFSAVHVFEVATAREDGVWSFDTRTATVPDEALSVAGELSTVGPLTVANGSWVTGPHTLFDSRDGDFALRLNGTSTEAVSQAGVVDTAKSFVVAAHVRLDATSSQRVAVSQSGPSSSSWRLGLTTSGCPSGRASCWSFEALSAGGVSKAVVSSVAPRAGEWTQLTAEYDAKTQHLRLWVCDIGTPERPAPGEPVLSQWAAPSKLQPGTGPIVLGRAQQAGAGVDRWKGEIDNVRIFKGEVVADAKIRRMCQGAEANQFARGVQALDPTTTVGQ